MALSFGIVSDEGSKSYSELNGRLVHQKVNIEF